MINDSIRWELEQLCQAIERNDRNAVIFHVDNAVTYTGGKAATATMAPETTALYLIALLLARGDKL